MNRSAIAFMFGAWYYVWTGVMPARMHEAKHLSKATKSRPCAIAGDGHEAEILGRAASE